MPEPPWRRPHKTRAPKQRKPLSRDTIVAKALEILDAEGIEGVSMRRIAAELGTGPASLYAYVADKDELLAAVNELALSELAMPNLDQPWQDVVREWAQSTYDLFRRHRDLARLSFADIPTGARALDISEAILRSLIEGGVEVQDAAWLIDRMVLYVGADAVEGYLLQERFGATDAAAAEVAGRQWIADVKEYFAALPPDRYPMITSHLAPMMSGGGDARFEFGMELLIAGIEARNPGSATKRTAKKRADVPRAKPVKKAAKKSK
nr:TetR/AcrR family transcriptional regulator [Flexivirga meconopsidis]